MFPSRKRKGLGMGASGASVCVSELKADVALAHPPPLPLAGREMKKGHLGDRTKR